MKLKENLSFFFIIRLSIKNQKMINCLYVLELERNVLQKPAQPTFTSPKSG